MQPQPKWIARSVTLIGLAGTAAGVIWDQVSPADISAISDAAQQILTYAGIVVAGIGRIRKGGGAPLTMMPRM